MARISPPSERADEKEVKEFLRKLAGRLLVDTFAWAPGTIGATTTVDTTLTSATVPQLAGLRAGCVVMVTPPGDLNAGLIVSHAVCGANNSLTVRLRNTSGAPVDQGSGTWSVWAVIP